MGEFEMRNLLARNPVATLVVDTASVNVTTAAWATLLAALLKGFDAMEVVNMSAQPLSIALGAAASEVAIPYTVPAGGSSGIMPYNGPKGARLSAKAIGADVTSGYVIFNFFG